MNSLDLISDGVQEIDAMAKEDVNGGVFGAIILGVAGALFATYQVGKAIGKEIYYEIH